MKQLGNKQATLFALLIVDSVLFYYSKQFLNGEATINNAFNTGYLLGMVTIISIYMMGTWLWMLINNWRVRWKKKK